MIEREQLEVDVLFVGAGPASLAGAIMLRKTARAAGFEPSILVIEKGAALGNHNLSGAVFDDRALRELSVGLEWTEPPPFDAAVTDDALWFLHEGGKIAAPLVPPALSNTGKRLLSINKFVAWLGVQAEALGIDCFPAFPATELVWEGDRIAGVQLGDKGVGADGTPQANFEAGPQIRARVTILGEGVRGTLTKQLLARLPLAAQSEPQTFALGVKELWRLPAGRFAPGRVVHTLGHPLPAETFGGGWLYGLEDDVLDIGLVVGLDSPDPSTDAHDAFNRFKLHPALRPLFADATLLSYGAKAIPEGGLFAQPRLYADGVMLIGDSAGFVNGMRLKGIHLAMKSGMLAAEAACAALQNDATDAAGLQRYDELFRESWAYAELRQARNFHQGFFGGLLPGLLNAGLGMLTGGRAFGVGERLAAHAGHDRLQRIAEHPPRAEARRVAPDGVITFGKLADVYHSGTRHDEHQPSHLRVADTAICAERCTREFDNPCKRFCPADVYHPDFQERDGVVTGELRIDFANCVHCKTCDIIDPYQIITWVPPQGGDGPVYTNM